MTDKAVNGSHCVTWGQFKIFMTALSGIIGMLFVWGYAHNKLEGHPVLQERVGSIQAMVNETKESLGSVQATVTDLDKKVDVLGIVQEQILREVKK